MDALHSFLAQYEEMKNSCPLYITLSFAITVLAFLDVARIYPVQ